MTALTLAAPSLAPASLALAAALLPPVFLVTAYPAPSATGRGFNARFNARFQKNSGAPAPTHVFSSRFSDRFKKS